MREYPLALCRELVVPIPAEETPQAWAGVNALGDELTDAGAFVFKSAPLPAESATAARLTRKQAS